MIKTTLTTTNFERDSLAAFEKLLQGYKKALQSPVWEGKLDDLIEKMTHLPTAPFEVKLMNLFDYNYLVLSEDIHSIIDKSLVIRKSMEHEERFVKIEEQYYLLPFLPKNTHLKSLKVFNHEGELCYQVTGRIYIQLKRLLICALSCKRNLCVQDVFTFKQTFTRLKDLKIHYYSPIIDLTTTDPQLYYDFLCDYYGKAQLLKYISSKEITSQNLENTLLNTTPRALEDVLKLSSSQQVIWAYFLFRLMGLRLRGNIDACVLTRFLLIVNKTSLEDYRNSYFYKLVAKAPHLKENKKLLVDLEIVRLHFQKNNLPIGDIETEILNLITNR